MQALTDKFEMFHSNKFLEYIASHFSTPLSSHLDTE